MKSLIEGVRRYEDQVRAKYTNQYARLAAGQAPRALFIGCADSRLVPNLISSTGPGELFVVRNVANVVPPAGSAVKDASVSSALWYAVEVLEVPEVIVCGHSNCGGIRALMSGDAPYGDLARWLAPAAPALTAWREAGGLDPRFPDHDQVSQLSTLLQIEHLASYDFVAKRVENGSLRLGAWWFDIGAGRPLVYAPAEGRFAPVWDEEPTNAFS